VQRQKKKAINETKPDKKLLKKYFSDKKTTIFKRKDFNEHL